MLALVDREGSQWVSHTDSRIYVPPNPDRYQDSKDGSMETEKHRRDKRQRWIGWPPHWQCKKRQIVRRRQRRRGGKPKRGRRLSGSVSVRRRWRRNVPKRWQKVLGGEKANENVLLRS